MAASISAAGRSSGPNVPLAPTTWNAGRSPLGRMGRTLAEVWTSSRRTSSAGVHAVALEQGEQHVAGRVRADGAGALHLGAELREHERRAAGRPGGRDADLLDELAALALGDRLHRPDEHVEHVHAGAERPHLVTHRSSSTRRVVP